MLLQSPNIYRKQILLIITATLFPAIVNVLYIFGITPIENINYVTATLCITGILIGWALFRYKFLDLIPMARDILVETMVDPVILLDSKQRILDANPAALKLFGQGEGVIGHLLSEMEKNKIGENLVLCLDPSFGHHSREDLVTIEN